MRSAAFGFARALLFAGFSLIFFTSAVEAELKPTEVAPGPPAAFARVAYSACSPDRSLDRACCN